MEFPGTDDAGRRLGLIVGRGILMPLKAGFFAIACGILACGWKFSTDGIPHSAPEATLASAPTPVAAAYAGPPRAWLRSTAIVAPWPTLPPHRDFYRSAKPQGPRRAS